MRRFVLLCLVFAWAVPLAADDLVFKSVNPCLVFDTRPAFGGTGKFVAEEERSFHIVGATADFAAQGGTAGGCGVPGFAGGQPIAKAVFMNYVAIEPSGAGQIKAWAADQTEPAQGALVNYQALTPAMNNSNGVVTELRQDSEGLDIKVRARSAGVHVRGVVLGYFLAAQPLLAQQKASLLRSYPQTFPVGTNPEGVAFDGANIWVANSGSHTVTKLRASDGVSLGSFPILNSPQQLAFDGSGMWVSHLPDKVTKLRASDGANLGTFTVGVSPSGMVFDGANIWVCNTGANSVTRLRATDGANMGTFSTGTAPTGIAFDGTNVWITNNGSASVTRYRVGDIPTPISGFGTSPGPRGIAFDGFSFWITTAATVVQWRSDGATGTYSAGSNPWGVAVDRSGGVFITNASGSPGTPGTVTKLHGVNGSFFGAIPVGITPHGIAFDGVHMWVSNYNSGTVTRF